MIVLRVIAGALVVVCAALLLLILAVALSMVTP